MTEAAAGCRGIGHDQRLLWLVDLGGAKAAELPGLVGAGRGYAVTPSNGVTSTDGAGWGVAPSVWAPRDRILVWSRLLLGTVGGTARGASRRGRQVREPGVTVTDPAAACRGIGHGEALQT